MQVSLANWNQDEAWGGFGGPHCMVKGGYSSLMEPLAASLQIKHDVVVSQVAYNSDGVTVTAASGESFTALCVNMCCLIFASVSQLSTTCNGVEMCTILASRNHAV